jgi:hypothetical protein
MRKLTFVLLFIGCVAGAQEAPPPPTLEPIPDGSPTTVQGEGPVAPTVTIRRLESGVIREYRAYGGRVYMVEVIPSVGPHYFLVDTDGSGNLVTRYNNFYPRLAIPNWILLQW